MQYLQKKLKIEKVNYFRFKVLFYLIKHNNFHLEFNYLIVK